MSAPLRLGAFAAVLAVVLGASFVAARALGVDLADDAAPVAAQESHSAGEAHDAGGHEAQAEFSGLTEFDGAYRLVSTSRDLVAGRPSSLEFLIVDAENRPLTTYDVEHAKRLHLIVVRRDLAHFQHLHPELTGPGTWMQEITLPAAGTYRMFADFTVDGERHTLGADLAVPGQFAPVPLPAAAARTTVDGYTVTLDGHPHAGEAAELEFAVTRGDAPVDDLEPYLGARGHLVALREGDLAYLHVHPTGDDAGNRIRFSATVPSPGTYRLYLQFQRGGVVHTAEHTLVVDGD